MPLTSYEATRLYELEQTQGLSLVEIRLRDSMRAREPQQAAEIATRAATDLARTAVEAGRPGETTAQEPVLASDDSFRAADLRSKLRDFGAAHADIDDALTLLERRVPGEYTESTLEDAIADLRNTRPELFATPRRPSPPPQASPQPTDFGAGGVAAARNRFPELGKSQTPSYGAAGVARANLRFETNPPSTA